MTTEDGSYNLRSRTVRFNESETQEFESSTNGVLHSDDDDDYTQRKRTKLSKYSDFLHWKHWAFVILYIALLHLTSTKLDKALPPVIDKATREAFSEERARDWLIKLVEMVRFLIYCRFLFSNSQKCSDVNA